MMKENDTKAQTMENTNSDFTPKRRVVEKDAAKRMALKCSEYNGSSSESRNFKCLEFKDMSFKGEDLSGMEAHYSKFTNCEFEECKLVNMEAHFAEFENCTFINCELRNSEFPFSKLSNIKFVNCNLRGTEFQFAQGEISCRGCKMENCDAQNSILTLTLSSVNAPNFSANSAHIEFDALDCNLRGSEFNDGFVEGQIVQSDLTNVELNRSNLSMLKLADCAVTGMETEGAIEGNSDPDDIFDMIENESEDEEED